MNKTLNQNWCNEVGNVWYCEEADLNKDGWLDPWNRPLAKSNCNNAAMTSEGWFTKEALVFDPTSPKMGKIAKLAIYNVPVWQGTLAELSKLLSLKFWYGGKVIYPFVHSYNRVKNALMIQLDGCCCYKFKVHKNGKLRCMRVYSIYHFDLKIRPLQTITLTELRNRIALHGDKHSTPYLQMTSPVPVPVDLAGWNYIQKARREANAAAKK